MPSFGRQFQDFGGLEWVSEDLDPEFSEIFDFWARVPQRSGNFLAHHVMSNS